MLREASPPVEDATPPVTGRARVRQGLRILAVAMNVMLFLAGLYFQAHPRDRRDLWTAGGVAGIALVNSASLTFSQGGPEGARRVTRLRRIALYANTILAAVAAVIVVLAALRGVQQAALHGALLLVPPLVTVAALRRYPPG